VHEGARRTLALLLGGLSGRRLSVQWLPRAPDAEAAARQRPILTDHGLLLPPALDFDTARAAVAHAAAHWCHSVAHQPAGALKPMSRLVIASVEDARVERLLARRLPGARPWFLSHLRVQTADGLSLSDLLARMGRALADADWGDPNPWVNKARDLFARLEALHGLDDPVPYRALGSILANDLGQMRVRLDTHQFVPPFAWRDDHSWLWAHEACACDPIPQALPHAQAGQSALHRPEAAPLRTFLYGEWNHRAHHMRADWCTVIERAHLVGADASAVPVYPRFALNRQHRPAHRHRLRRQREGDAIDFDAGIRFVADVRDGRAPDLRLFMRWRRQAAPAALLVLMDLSQSTLDTVVPGGGTLRTLVQQAALALAVAGRAAGHRVAVHGFSSNTRHAVAYTRLLEAGEPLDAAALSRIAAAPARHSTRLGAALRHATALLAGAQADCKAVLVLTDGHPSDIDVHDHRYLTEDARHAVGEAGARGVEVMGLGTDASAAPALRSIFGRHARLSPEARQLPAQLMALYAQLRC
jgi:hypothetical protein